MMQNMEKDDKELIFSILIIDFKNGDKDFPIIDVPSVLNKEEKEFIGTICLSLLSGEELVIPRSFAMIPFPTLKLKGLIKYLEWKDASSLDKPGKAAIAIVFEEADDLIFYKYNDIFESSINSFSRKITELKENKANIQEISNETNKLLSDIRIKMDDLWNKEASHQDVVEFPDDATKEFDTSEYVFKIVVAGEPQVGKTSVVLKFTDKAFTRTYIPTLGVNITEKNLRAEDSIIQLTIWDIAGQSKFDRMRKHFYKGAEGVILIFDLTNKKSFDSIKNWYKDIKLSVNYPKDLVGFLVANKKDLRAKREVSEKEAEALADKLRFRYVETSVLTGENVMFIFHKLGELLLNDLMEKEIKS